MYTTAEQERSRMIEENIGLVHACAHRFKGKGIEYDDLFQAGCMGLVKATDAFDTERGRPDGRLQLRRQEPPSLVHL